MINSILKFPIPYRLYQKSVRSKFDEYNFINYIFKELNKISSLINLSVGLRCFFVL